MLSYHGCELIDLWYDEGNLLQDLEDVNTIILLSNHTLGSAEADDGSESDTVREEWQWHLTRTDAEADWELLTAGYGRFPVGGVRRMRGRSVPRSEDLHLGALERLA